MTNEQLTFKEMNLEFDYLQGKNKQEKKSYKAKTVYEKREILNEFKIEQDAEKERIRDLKENNLEQYKKEKQEKDDKQFKNDMGSIKSWIKKHKIWSFVIAFVLASCIIGPFIDDEDVADSEEPKKETVTKDDNKDKQEAKKAQDKKDAEDKKKQEIAEEKANQEQADKDAKAKEKKEKSKKPLTDEQKLNKKLKKEVTSADVKGVEFGTGQSDVTIELKGKSNMSDKMTSRGFKMGTVEALLALKKSGIDVDSAEIYVYFPLNDGMKDEEKMVMSTRWDRATIDAMNEDAKYTLPDAIESHAESSFIHPVMRKSEK